jgi:hypothetical protein
MEGNVFRANKPQIHHGVFSIELRSLYRVTDKPFSGTKIALPGNSSGDFRGTEYRAYVQ